jgi:hypothetical protein
MNNELVLTFFNEYYISNRKKFLIQQGNGEYITVNRTLSDMVIRKHLNHDMTIGIFSGKELTKFICFDIDSKENSENNLRELALILEEYGIARENMLITFSGSKGFHLEVFFTKVLPVKLLKNFYFKILDELQIDKTEIEFRPSLNQGVKLPLGINFKSGLYCFPLSPYTFTRISKEEALTVEKVDTNNFIDILLDIEVNMIDIFSNDIVSNALNKGSRIDFNLSGNENIKNDILAVLEAGKLLKKGTRNYITFNLALYFKSLGYSKEEIQKEIFRVLKNTYEEEKDFFNEETDLEYIILEIIRIIDFVFKKDYFLKNNKIEKVEIKTYEILNILQLKKENQKLALILLYHSKSVGSDYNTFYMTYKQINNLGGSPNRSSVYKMVENLREVKFLEVVERGSIDIQAITKNGDFKYLPNKYKVIEKSKVKGLRDKKISLVGSDILNIDIDDIIVKLFSKDYLKENLSKNIFYDRFNKLFKS